MNRIEDILFGVLQILIAILVATAAYGVHFLTPLASALIVAIVVVCVVVVPLLAGVGDWARRHAVLVALAVGILLGLALPLTFSSGGFTGTDTSLRFPSAGFLLLLALPAVACAVSAGRLRAGARIPADSRLLTLARAAYWIGSGFAGVVAVVMTRQALHEGASGDRIWASLLPVGLVLVGAVLALHTSDLGLARWESLSSEVQSETRAFLFQSSATVLLLVGTLCVAIVLTAPDQTVSEVLVTLLYAASILLIPQASWLRVRMHD